MSDRSLEDKIVESIPNISEGRNREIVESIVDEVRNTEGCILMNYSSDKDHNRSVISYIGSPKAVEDIEADRFEKTQRGTSENGCRRRDAYSAYKKHFYGGMHRNKQTHR